MWKRLKTFSLRTLLVLLVVTCVCGAVIANYSNEFHKEQELLLALKIKPQDVKSLKVRPLKMWNPIIFR